jgi:hypothetical protein
MSVRHRPAPRRSRGPAGALLVTGLALSLGLASSATAQPPPLVTRLPADVAGRAGLAVDVARHRLAGQDLLEVRIPSAPRAAPAGAPPAAEAEDAERREALRLLDQAANGSLAIADAIGDPAAGLTVVEPDGSQVHVAVPGVAGAAFAPRGDWLAVVDASGTLWRVDAAAGSALPVANGPFAGSVTVGTSGELVLPSLSSMEAPYASSLVRVDPGSGRAVPVTSEDESLLVFATRVLADGSLAVVAHRFGGGVGLYRIAGGRATELLALDPGAVDASISDDGSAVAYALPGDGTYLGRAGEGAPMRITSGELPRIAPDGGAVAVLQAGATVVVDATGRTIDRLASPYAAWVRCERGCGA